MDIPEFADPITEFDKLLRRLSLKSDTEALSRLTKSAARILLNYCECRYMELMRAAAVGDISEQERLHFRGMLAFCGEMIGVLKTALEDGYTVSESETEYEEPSDWSAL